MLSRHGDFAHLLMPSPTALRQLYVRSAADRADPLIHQSLGLVTHVSRIAQHLHGEGQAAFVAHGTALSALGQSFDAEHWLALSNLPFVAASQWESDVNNEQREALLHVCATHAALSADSALSLGREAQLLAAIISDNGTLLAPLAPFGKRLLRRCTSPYAIPNPLIFAPRFDMPYEQARYGRPRRGQGTAAPLRPSIWVPVHSVYPLAG